MITVYAIMAGAFVGLVLYFCIKIARILKDLNNNDRG